MAKTNKPKTKVKPAAKKADQKPKVALITGVAGQDGSYLVEFLLSKGYRVIGLVRPIMRSWNALFPIEVLSNPMFMLAECDVMDVFSLQQMMSIYKPDEVYNLAAQSFVGTSWGNIIEVTNVNAIGAMNVFEACRGFSKKSKIYQASTSEMFGNLNGTANEKTSFRPRSPYGVSKVFAHNMAVNYRESFGLFISCGILFNHESPRRGSQFVTQKIIQAAKTSKKVALGNINVKRDWGYAKEYVEAMWLMLQQDKPDDYVIATGETHSLQDFIEEVKKYCPELEVAVDPGQIRPADISYLQADISKAKVKLNWESKVKLPELVKIMWDGENQENEDS